MPVIESVIFEVSSDGASGADTFSDPNLANNGFDKSAQIVRPPEQTPLKVTARLRRTQELAELSTRVSCTIVCQFTATATARVAGQTIVSKPETKVVTRGGNIVAVHFSFARRKLNFLNAKGGTATIQIDAISSIGQQQSLAPTVVLRGGG